MNIILLAVIAAVVTQLLGWAWHGPLFGKKYADAIGVSPMTPDMPKHMPGMAWYLVLNFVANLVMAFVFFNLLGAFGAFSFGTAFHTGLIVFLGFILPMFTTAILWNGRPAKSQKVHFAISLGYYLVNFAIWTVLFALLA